MTGVASVDSAAVARVAWERATKALSDHDLLRARREADRAVGSWPTQPAYLWADAVLAARDGDSATAFRSLDAYSKLGLGRDLRADSTFSKFGSLASFIGLASAHDANRAVVARSRERAGLRDTTFWPEGVDYDSRNGRFYVASIRHRTIAEIAADGSSRELWPRDGSRVGAMFGVRVDTARGVLWATTSGIPQMANHIAGDSAIAALLRIRIRDGVVERRWDLPVVPGGHVLGDLAVGPHGDIYVTDSNEPVLYRLRPGADTLEAIRSPLFRSLQGIAPSPDGKLAYVADYSHGILRVDVTTAEVTRVDDAPNSTSLGVDGIVWDRGAIIAVQNGVVPARIMRFVLDATGRGFSRADLLDRNTPLSEEPTIGTLAGNEFVYVANSHWNEYDEEGRRNASRPLTRPRLLAVPLPR